MVLEGSETELFNSTGDEGPENLVAGRSSPPPDLPQNNLPLPLPEGQESVYVEDTSIGLKVFLSSTVFDAGQLGVMALELKKRWSEDKVYNVPPWIS